MQVLGVFRHKVVIKANMKSDQCKKRNEMKMENEVSKEIAYGTRNLTSNVEDIQLKFPKVRKQWIVNHSPKCAKLSRLLIPDI